MAEITQKLTKFFNDLYGDLATSARARRVRHEVEKFILSVKAPDAPENQGHESAQVEQ